MAIADVKVAEVSFILDTYRFCAKVALQIHKRSINTCFIVQETITQSYL